MSQVLQDLKINIEAYADAKGTHNAVLTKRAGDEVLKSIDAFAAEISNQCKSQNEKQENTSSPSL